MTSARATVPEDLRRAHRERRLPPSGRRRAAAQVLHVGLGVLVVGLVVAAVTTSAWTMLAGLGGVLPSLVLHPRGTDVTAQALRRRNGLVRGRWVPWEDVVSVEPPGRWRDHGIARLADGRVMDLVGMAPDDVVRLAAALAEARAAPGGARD